MEKAQIIYQNSVFRGGQNMRRMKTCIFSKIAWHYLCQEGRKLKLRKNYKIVVSAAIS